MRQNGFVISIKLEQTASLLGTQALGYECASETWLCKRLGSVWIWLWWHELLRSPGINLIHCFKMGLRNWWLISFGNIYLKSWRNGISTDIIIKPLGQSKFDVLPQEIAEVVVAADFTGRGRPWHDRVGTHLIGSSGCLVTSTPWTF